MPFLIVPRRRQSKGTGLKWQVRVGPQSASFVCKTTYFLLDKQNYIQVKLGK